MENQEQDNKEKSTEVTPKPTDEVQLTIETVTPDTHKSVPETPVDSEKVEEKVEGANDNEEIEVKADEQQAKSGEESDTKDNGVDEKDEKDEKVTTEDATDDEEEELDTQGDAHKGSDDDGEGDIRDSIETVAP